MQKLASICRMLHTLILLSSLMSSASAGSHTCDLKDVHVETIKVSSLMSISDQDDDLRLMNGEKNRDANKIPSLRRNQEEKILLSAKAIVVQVLDDRVLQNSKLFDQSASSNEQNQEMTVNDESKNSEISTIQGRLCDCGYNWLLPTDDLFYCPLNANQCNVWRESSKYRVSCTRRDWKVSFSRYVWYYLVFFIVILIMYLFCSVSGHHSIKYLLAPCFPGINTWITKQILQMELQQWTRVREESLYAVHLKRRTIGWISGYKIKTKRYYFCAAATDKNDSGLHRSSNCDNRVDIPGGMNRSNKCDEAKAMTDDDMCTICLLDLEHGDRIADLQCCHFYHADCLSEWVLKKNICPLCQDPGVAEEIRSFETEDDFISSNPNNDVAKSFYARWWHRARETYVDVVTGTTSNQKRQLMQNMQIAHAMNEVNNAQ